MKQFSKNKQNKAQRQILEKIILKLQDDEPTEYGFLSVVKSLKLLYDAGKREY